MKHSVVQAFGFVCLAITSIAQGAQAQSTDVDLCRQLSIDPSANFAEIKRRGEACGRAIAAGGQGGRLLAELYYGRAYGLLYGDLLTMQQNTPAAIKDLEEAERLAPDWGDAYAAHGTVTGNTPDGREQRIKLYTLAITNNARSSFELIYRRGFEYAMLGRHDEATTDFCAYLALFKAKFARSRPDSLSEGLKLRAEAGLNGMKRKC